jgi:phosphatidylserine/phosphatidylglycerophosphate/cardiolipin synthase-like enzyme
MTGPQDWLIAGGLRASSSTDVTTYRSTYDLYPEMCAAIRKAHTSEHFIYLLGWHVEISGSKLLLVLGDKSTSLEELFKEANKNDVTIRAMWDAGDITTPGRGKDNERAVKFVNNLTHGAAVLDDRRLEYGVHHQKILIVFGDDGLVAFVGGWDLHPDRWNWADTEVKLTGGAAQDVLEVFTQRWFDYQKAIQRQTPLLIPRVTGAKKGPNPTRQVQIGRTYGNAPRHGGLPATQGPSTINPPSSKPYDFAPNGEFTAYEMIRNAISRAREFIYVEDQYLFASGMANLPDLRDLLAKRVAEVPDLKFIALINRTENLVNETRQPWFRRREFITRIRSGAPGRVTVLQYKSTDPYLHSKCWIIDDQFAIVGSANCNRRGYSHDSEVVAGIAGKNPSGNEFAHEFRIQLWLGHLNPRGGAPPKYAAADVKDWRNGLKLLLDPSARTELYDEKAGTDPPHSVIPHIRLGATTVTTPTSWLGQQEWDIVDADGS